MASAFQTIGLIGRLRCDETAKTVHDLLAHLQQSGFTIVIEQDTATLVADTSSLTVVDIADLGAHCDVAIVVGGDGSLLSAARAVLAHQTPLIGINRGYLGFLTDIHPQDFADELDSILAGNFVKEERFLLRVTIANAQQTESDTALNDVVLSPGKIAQLIEFDVYVNDQWMCHQRADGLIVSTPTGSTAYALSAGGPIIHPKLDAIVLTPMFPHTLGSRPIVIDGNSRIKLVIDNCCEAEPNLSADGQRRKAVSLNSDIIIEKNPQPVQLIHPKTYNYFATLRQKLGWESKPQLGQR